LIDKIEVELIFIPLKKMHSTKLVPANVV